MTDTGELDAIIIRNITEIEQGYDRICDEIEKRLDDESGRVFREVAGEYGWFTKATSLDDDFWMTKHEWQIEDGAAEQSDHYLAITLEANSSGPDVSWAQTFIGGQGAQLLLAISSDLFTSAKWFRFLRDGKASKVVERIIKSSGSKISFDPDNKYEPFARGVRIDQEELARAFAGEIEFEKALSPLASALRETLDLEAEFKELVRSIKDAQ